MFFEKTEYYVEEANGTVAVEIGLDDPLPFNTTVQLLVVNDNLSRELYYKCLM